MKTIERLTIDADPAVFRLALATHHAQERGLAGTVGPHQRMNIAGRNRRRHPIEHQSRANANPLHLRTGWSATALPPRDCVWPIDYWTLEPFFCSGYGARRQRVRRSWAADDGVGESDERFVVASFDGFAAGDVPLRRGGAGCDRRNGHGLQGGVQFGFLLAVGLAGAAPVAWAGCGELKRRGVEGEPRQGLTRWIDVVKLQREIRQCGVVGVEGVGGADAVGDVILHHEGEQGERRRAENESSHQQAPAGEDSSQGEGRCGEEGRSGETPPEQGDAFGRGGKARTGESANDEAKRRGSDGRQGAGYAVPVGHR